MFSAIIAASIFGAQLQPAPPDFLDRVSHHYVDSDGVKIHYASVGEGPLVVMIHGWPDFWFTWHHQMAALADSFRVVALDTRGYNLSDKPEGDGPYRFPMLVGDVAAVIRDCGAEKATVVGHDWGGAIAWGIAMSQPALVERLIICNLPHPRGLSRELANNPAQQEASGYAREFQQEGSENNLSVDLLVSIVAPEDGAVKALYAEAFGRSSFAAMMAYYRMNYPREPYVENTAPVVKLSMPVLQFHGLADTALLPAALAGTQDWIEKDWTLVTVPGAGHWVHHDAHALVSQTMRDWLLRGR
jgi:pimeloyl-ACP methyl ester carboxylesterase